MGVRLSICIPTRNRADVLAVSLESLTSQPFFAAHDDIEVVISDNASTDHTSAVVASFTSQYGQKVRYFCNSQNILDSNFESALRRGNGSYLKLLNDTVLWKPDALELLYKLVLEHEQQQPTIFFLNGCKKTTQPTLDIRGLDAFVETVSYFMTWIGGFGIWKDQLEAMPDFSRLADTSLVQVDVLMRLLDLNPHVIVSNQVCFNVQNAGRKGGYSLARVFGQNYLTILSRHLGSLTEKTFAQEKKAVLIEHILVYHFHPDHDFHFYPLEKFLDNFYLNEPYYSVCVNDARADWIKSMRAKQEGSSKARWSSRLKVAIALWMLRRKPEHRKSKAKIWRISNSHNDTSMGRPFDFKKVRVGNGSYGQLNVLSWGHPEELLEIGHFVSIAENVQFLLGGNHDYHTLSTYPFKSMMLGHTQESTTKGPIVVKDDVWIGYGALILSGVTLGQGSVIAAGSVVVSDVPAYAIVAGNPAKVVKYRFPEPLVQRLSTLKWSQLTKEAVWARPDLISERITLDNLDEVARGLGLTPEN
jgi:acetyltransferase-like isoleucine patch superfamily enzyme